MAVFFACFFLFFVFSIFNFHQSSFLVARDCWRFLCPVSQSQDLLWSDQVCLSNLISDPPAVMLGVVGFVKWRHLKRVATSFRPREALWTVCLETVTLLLVASTSSWRSTASACAPVNSNVFCSGPLLQNNTTPRATDRMIHYFGSLYIRVPVLFVVSIRTQALRLTSTGLAPRHVTTVVNIFKMSAHL